MKSYKCVFEGCAKSFRKPSLLKQHLFTHTDTRSFRCTLCTKAYFKGSHLSVHMRSHYPKEFCCAVCDKSFTTKDKLKRHGDCRETHVCQICKKVYRRRKCFENHVVKHRRTRKTHTCGICKGIYANGKSLRQHARTHARAGTPPDQEHAARKEH